MAAIHAHRRAVQPVGPPPGYTGLIAPGYAPAGDPRLIEYVDDDHPATLFSAGWARGTDPVYYNQSVHSTQTAGETVRLSYYGGGFQGFNYSYYLFAPSDVYDNGVYVGTVRWQYPAANGSPYLHLQAEILLPVGLHNLEFRPQIPGNPIGFHDCIRLLRK